jgi:hypothetical protein
MTEAATVASTSAASSGRRQFQAVFESVIPFKTTITEASIATGAAGVSAGDITVPGAALGDFVLFAPKADIVDLVVSGQVTAANTVTVTLVNLTGGAVTALSAGVVFNGVVLKAGPHFDAPSAF